MCETTPRYVYMSEVCDVVLLFIIHDSNNYYRQHVTLNTTPFMVEVAV